MKYLALIAEGLADDPVAELDGRTPLEIAKTPHLTALAKKGAVAGATFAPQSDLPTPDVACLSILGFDPREFYTGLAPLEALALGIAQNDREIAFRCDLVTAADDTLMDPSAGSISGKESSLLIEELNRKFAGSRFKLYNGRGYKNILIVNDPELADDLSELDCMPPARFIGQKISKHLPKGRGEQVLSDLIDQSKAVLENNEINRVRIDLGENPANLLWPWGQGRCPKLPGFSQRFGKKGAVLSDVLFMKGLAKAAGLGVVDSVEAGLENYDFLFVYFPAASAKAGKDLKMKIRHIEEFDSAVVGPALKKAAEAGAHRILVGTDNPESLARKSAIHGQVPMLLAGDGVQGEANAGFNEKSASQSRLSFGEGFKLMEYFLK